MAVSVNNFSSSADQLKWPWVASLSSEPVLKKQLPKLSVIIPSFNQGNFLEETILSVLNQCYPNLELIIIDGGSTDTSTDILRKYDSKIAFWISEEDRGQSHAINKGLEKATGEWVAWLNSDDCYLEGALLYVFNTLPLENYDFVFGNCSIGSSLSQKVDYNYPSTTRKDLGRILRFFYNPRHIIPSQSVFVRKSLIDKAGVLDEQLHYCMDLDWFCRFFIFSERRLFYNKIICFFRVTGGTKTSSPNNKIPAEAVQITYRYLPYLSLFQKKSILRLLYLHRILLYSSKKKIKQTPMLFMRVFCRVPLQAFKDKRFWGRIKLWMISKIKHGMASYHLL